MLNSGDWQAIAECLGVILVIANGLGGMFIYRMQASFVTRAEHGAMGKRIDVVEDQVNGLDKKIGTMLTATKADEMFNRIGAVERQGAELLGEMSGINKQLSAANNMLQMLVQNEIEGGKSR